MLIKRNITLFFRDKANVFFSLLAVFIIIGLYALFLGGVMEDSLAEIPGLSVDAKDKLDVIASLLMLSGMVAVTAVTASQGALGIAVIDKTTAAKDFLTSPAPRGKTVFSYIVGSAVCSAVMTVAALILSIVYIVIIGGEIPAFSQWGKILLALVLSVLCANSMVYFISTFIRSANAFTAFSTVLGTLIGFIMGIYIPIGQLPEGVGWVIKCFPMSHAASMLKLTLVDDELSAVFSPPAAEAIRELFGVTFTYGEYTSGYWFSALVLTAFTMIFFGAAVVSQKVHSQKM
ncbi:MAG: ABC transporter permease [Ruminococcus sp.]|jgi:multidrug/hemolysin transport system permease protein|nr:ABC transporter permease [Ruminococcus sp.]